MLFTEAVAEVTATVKRPDLAARIKREVNAAISFYCLDNEFSRDFQEQSVSIDANEYTQSFILATLTRFRRFKYIKRGGTKKFLEKFSDAEMFKGCFDEDKYYIAGDSVYISMKQLASTLDVGYWKYPPVLTGSLSSDSFWLLEAAPFMVIDRATASIFKQIGDEKSFSVHRQQAAEAYAAARKDLINS